MPNPHSQTVATAIYNNNNATWTGLPSLSSRSKSPKKSVLASINREVVSTLNKITSIAF